MSPLGESDADTLDLTAAVDTAARDWWARTTRSGAGFDDLNAHDQHTARAFVRPTVAAAAPVIAEQAWDEGYRAGRWVPYAPSSPQPLPTFPNPYQKKDRP